MVREVNRRAVSTIAYDGMYGLNMLSEKHINPGSAEFNR